MANESSPAMFAATDRFASRSADLVLLIARVLLGWLFFTNGWMKLMNVAGGIAYLTNLHVPNPGFWIWPCLMRTPYWGHAHPRNSDALCIAVYVRLSDHRHRTGASLLAISGCAAGRPIRALLQESGIDGRGLGAVLGRARPLLGRRKNALKLIL